MLCPLSYPGCPKVYWRIVWIDRLGLGFGPRRTPDAHLTLADRTGKHRDAALKVALSHRASRIHERGGVGGQRLFEGLVGVRSLRLKPLAQFAKLAGQRGHPCAVGFAMQVTP